MYTTPPYLPVNFFCTGDVVGWRGIVSGDVVGNCQWECGGGELLVGTWAEGLSVGGGDCQGDVVGVGLSVGTNSKKVFLHLPHSL